MYLPFGENFTKDTGGLSSSISVFKHCPEAVSQIRLKILSLFIYFYSFSTFILTNLNTSTPYEFYFIKCLNCFKMSQMNKTAIMHAILSKPAFWADGKGCTHFNQTSLRTSPEKFFLKKKLIKIGARVLEFQGHRQTHNTLKLIVALQLGVKILL